MKMQHTVLLMLGCLSLAVIGCQLVPGNPFVTDPTDGASVPAVDQDATLASNKAAATSIPSSPLALDPAATPSSVANLDTNDRDNAILLTPEQTELNVAPVETGVFVDNPAAATTTTLAETNASTPVAPINPQMGSLTVKGLEECGISYELQQDGEFSGRGGTSRTIEVAAGAYDVVYQNGESKKHVLVQEGEEAILDISSEIGGLVVTTYSGPGVSIYYKIPAIGIKDWITDRSSTWCLQPGTYNIYYNHVGGSMELNVEVAGGEVTVVDPVTWPYQLGWLAFEEGNGWFDVYDFQTGDRLGSDSTTDLNTKRVSWLPEGKYKIVLTSPYVGVRYEAVVITAGQGTLLALPTATPSSP